MNQAEIIILDHASLILNFIGMSLNIIGAYLLYQYAIPKHLDSEGSPPVMDEQHPEHLAEQLHYKKLSKLGFALIAMGFCLQFVAEFVSSAFLQWVFG